MEGEEKDEAKNTEIVQERFLKMKVMISRLNEPTKVPNERHFEKQR